MKSTITFSAACSPGEHRAKQDHTAQFYRALYEECQRRKIPAAWAPDNSALIAGIMSNLNFNANAVGNDQPH